MTTPTEWGQRSIPYKLSVLFLELFAELANSVMSVSDSWIVQNLRAIIADLSDESTFTEITYDVAEGYRWRIELMYRDLLAKELLYGGDLCGGDSEALGYLAQAYATMCQFIDSLMVHYPAVMSQSSTQLLITGGVGRPLFEIPHGQLQFLIDSRFSVPQIAQLLGVSVSTVRRRMSSYNLYVPPILQ